MRRIVFFLITLMVTGNVWSQKQLIKRLKQGEKQIIVVYGTSLSDCPKGWPLMLQDSLNAVYPGKVEVINSAKGAMWSTLGVQNLDKRVLEKKPDLVLMEFAINDAYLPYNTSLMVCQLNLEYMIDRIQEAYPKCEIILQVMNMPYGEAERPNLEAYYNVYRKVAKKRKLKLIDHSTYWKKIHAQGEKEFKKWVPDTLHPGENAWKTYIVPYLLKEFGVER